jgi:DNA-binding NarL/FixJ family response regulator
MKKMHEIHIAFADDHNLVRQAIVSNLNLLTGINVDIEARNGRELVTQLKKAAILPDICLLDINMPEMNGFETLSEIKSRWPDIKVLILTAYDLELYIIRMILNGANGYLLKSCTLMELKEAIYSIYTDGVYYSESTSRNFFHSVQNKDIKLPHLTEREIQVLKYTCDGDLSFTDIAKMVQLPEA